MRGTPLRQGCDISGFGIIPAYAGNTNPLIRLCAFSWDHPRVCGEHACSIASATSSSGSSPRMRGTRVVKVWILRAAGIIPAYAGNTSPVLRRCFWPRDHPRVCGEHLPITLPKHVRQGSSPRMRGTPIILPLTVFIHGIIPAYAGNTQNKSIVFVQRRDHPRVCGEHVIGHDLPSLEQGSSPRMRGTLISAVNPRFNHGIIPAYAGNTNGGCLRLICHRDHPRVCGEHSETKADNSSMTGSSPRMRGTLTIPEDALLTAWIIPAYAGNTFPPIYCLLFMWDHPRVCGEHSFSLIAAICAAGSSPRMRGTQIPAKQGVFPLGIIPAYAGNTNPRQLKRFNARDHPRVCGEHVTFFPSGLYAQGSSPRMRGTPPLFRRQ